MVAIRAPYVPAGRSAAATACYSNEPVPILLAVEHSLSVVALTTGTNTPTLRAQTVGGDVLSRTAQLDGTLLLLLESATGRDSLCARACFP